MPKPNIEYIKYFFNHFGIQTNSVNDISIAREQFQKIFNISLSFSEIVRAHLYSSKVFSITSIHDNKTKWFSSIDDMIQEILLYKNNNIVIRMPRCKKHHMVILQNNDLRSEYKKLLGISPNVSFSPYNQNVVKIKASVPINFWSNVDSFKHVVLILNKYEEFSNDYATLLMGNENYRLFKDFKDKEKVVIFLYSLDNLEMVLTSLRFAGIHSIESIDIYTNEGTLKNVE